MPPKKAPNAARRATRTAPKPVVSDALKDAIDTLPEQQLRSYITEYCHTMQNLREALEKDFLVPGKDVVRYHADTASEDSEQQESSSETEAGDDNQEALNRTSKNSKPIIIGDDEFAPRIAICQNCKEEFDVTSNRRGDCVWHTGSKDVNFDEDFWADHDPDCHGEYMDWVDEPDMAEGFIWTCCGQVGDDKGCKSTIHKSSTNTIVKGGRQGQKRKANEAPAGTKKKTRR